MPSTRAVLQILNRPGRPWTPTWEFSFSTSHMLPVVLHPHRAMTELRRKGYKIDRRWAKDRKYKEYRLVSKPKKEG